MSLLNDILRNAVAAKASDIHINVGLPPLFRIHTVVTHSDFPIVTPEGASRVAAQSTDARTGLLSSLPFSRSACSSGRTVLESLPCTAS